MLCAQFLACYLAGGRCSCKVDMGIMTLNCKNNIINLML